MVRIKYIGYESLEPDSEEEEGMYRAHSSEDVVSYQQQRGDNCSGGN